MAEINVTELESGVFNVTVEEGDGSSTEHRVTVDTDPESFAPGTSASDLVEASFRFLLDREPKESILRSFELGVISRYFPEYSSELNSYL